MKFKVNSLDQASTPLDLDPKVLIDFFNCQLNEGLSGKRKVLACVIMPDYSELLKYEIMRAELITGFKITKNQQGRFLSCILPKAFKNDREYQKKMKNIEFLVDKELTKLQIGSQSAFLVLDSLSSVLKLSSQFRQKPVY